MHRPNRPRRQASTDLSAGASFSGEGGCRSERGSTPAKQMGLCPPHLPAPLTGAKSPVKKLLSSFMKRGLTQSPVWPSERCPWGQPTVVGRWWISPGSTGLWSPWLLMVPAWSGLTSTVRYGVGLTVGLDDLRGLFQP